MGLILWLKDRFSGGVDASFYRENQAELRSTNYKLLQKACFFSTGMCLFLFCLTLLNSLISELTIFYLCYTLFFAVFSGVVLMVVNRRRQLVPIFFYLFASAIFILVIDVGTRWTPDLPAVTFHVFLLIIPILHVARPWNAVLLSVTACGVFCVVTTLVKGPGTFLAQTDMLNAICCCIVGIGLDITIITLHLENISGKAHFKHQSATDELTGLPNRRSFDLHIQRLFQARLRAGRNLTLFMMDIDNFKSYNDSYGHIQGDACLQRVARALERAATRHGIFLARFGGEEFVAVAAQHNREAVAQFAQACVDGVAALQLSHREAPGGIITLSVGYAGLQETGAKHHLQLLGCADDALYSAKADGKNRAVAWKPVAFDFT